jgi:cobaltochelatase CobN
MVTAIDGGRVSTSEPLRTNRGAFGQLALCVGCCCGRPDRGYPPVPVDHLKAAWKGEKLNKAAGDDDFDSLLAWARDCKTSGMLQPLPARFAGRTFDRFPPVS